MFIGLGLYCAAASVLSFVKSRRRFRLPAAWARELRLSSYLFDACDARDGIHFDIDGVGLRAGGFRLGRHCNPFEFTKPLVSICHTGGD